MDNRINIDRSILIPIGIGAISMIGICIILLTGYLDKPQAIVPVEQAVTPFKFLFLATETATPETESETALSKETVEEESTAAATRENTPTSTQERISGSPTSPVDAPAQTETPTTNNDASATAISTFDENAITAGKYDDTDARLDYNGDWVNELFVSDAFKLTLYISPTIGDSVTFTFIGRQIIIGYLSDTDFGTLTIKIDNNEYLLNQSSGSEWVSVQLSPGAHSVSIFHKDGDFVSLDYINIIE